MNGVESVVSLHFWWVPYLGIGLGLLALFKAADNALSGSYLLLNREKAVTDPWIASFIRGMKERGEKPPPYWMYAAGWLAVGVTLIVAGFQMLS